jgi:hypothetical protein
VAPLDPCRLDPVASVNRARLDGRTARELLSAPALVQLARAHGLDPIGPVRSYLDGHLAGPAVHSGAARAAAVAAEFGGRLGRLVGTLRAGDRSARPEWDDSWWARWAAVDTVHLGGGLAGGAFGTWLATAAEGPAGCRVTVAPDDLPLLGAARRNGPGLVLDFGHTLVKRAVVTPSGLERLPSVPAPAEDSPGPLVAAAVAAILAAAWAEAGRPDRVTAAMAAYVVDGQPVRTPLGTYARLADVSPDVPGWLAARTGVPVTLVHDGTAAAHAVPPDPRAVVILLGTSIGVGFPHDCPA